VSWTTQFFPRLFSCHPYVFRFVPRRDMRVLVFKVLISVLLNTFGSILPILSVQFSIWFQSLSIPSIQTFAIRSVHSFSICWYSDLFNRSVISCSRIVQSSSSQFVRSSSSSYICEFHILFFAFSSFQIFLICKLQSSSSSQFVQCSS
jgi:hypothetical protein